MLTIRHLDTLAMTNPHTNIARETRPQKRISEGFKFLQSLTTCLDQSSNILTAEELVIVASKLSLLISLDEATALMNQAKGTFSREPFHMEELRDSCHKVSVPGHPFSLKFFHLRLIAKKLATEKQLSSTEAFHQMATMWEKVKSAMDLLQFYTTKWKRMKAGSMIAVKKPRLIEIMFLRHSQSESNLGWDLFKQEPFVFDPSLTMKGYIQSAGKSLEMRNSPWQPDIIVSSPLRRSLMTASITMKHTRGKCPWIVHPFCRELVSGADDIGSLKPDLVKEFPYWNFDLLTDDFWWYYPGNKSSAFPQSLNAHRAAYKENPWHEPRSELVPLIQAMFDWLTSLPVERILVASHGSYIERAINYKPFRNCQTRTITVDPSKPYVF